MITVSKLSAKIILDSRGDKTIEVTAQLSDGSKGIASVPQGKGVGTHAARYISPKKAVKNIKELDSRLRGNDRRGVMLAGKDVFKQEEIDKSLNKELGANVTLGISLAIARAAAKSKGIPLWKYIRDCFELRSRNDKKGASLRGAKRRSNLKLYINMIEGGVHAKNKLSIQEFLVVFKEKTIADSLKLSKKFYAKLGRLLKKRYEGKVSFGDEGGFAIPENDNFVPLNIFNDVSQSLKTSFSYGVDVAANNIKGTMTRHSALMEVMIGNYPVFYVEDPYPEKDFKNFTALTKKYGKSVLVIGDDLTTTNLARAKKAYDKKSINGIIIKPNQIGTLTETLEVIRQGRKWGWKIIVSHRSGETKDDFIADLAWAVSADGVKFGAPIQPERLVKYKRLIQLSS